MRIHYGIIIGLALAIAGVTAFAYASAKGLEKYQKGFQTEMAQRLDLEEKIVKIERERGLLTEENEDLKKDCKVLKNQVKELKAELSMKEDEVEGLAEDLEFLKSRVSSTSGLQE